MNAETKSMRSVVRKLEAKAKMYRKMADTTTGIPCTYREVWLACENTTIAAINTIYTQKLCKGSK